MLRIICLILFCSLIFAAPAYAYIDPGVGSMMLQALAAGAIAAALFWRRCLTAIKDFFNRKTPPSNEVE